MISDFDNTDTFVLRIGNKPDARYKGGFNIFGKGFGDYQQDIRVEMAYDLPEEGGVLDKSAAP